MMHRSATGAAATVIAEPGSEPRAGLDHPDRRHSVALVIGPEPSWHSTLLSIEPFRTANRLSRSDLFDIDFIALDEKAAPTGLHVSLPPPATLDHGRQYDLVILIITYGVDEEHKAQLLRWLRRQSARGAHICAVDVAPILLAEAGLLDGYRITGHWSTFASFRDRFPEIELVEQLYVIDRNRSTCAGQVSVLDLSMCLLERLCGPAIRRAVGNDMIYNAPRPADTRQRDALADLPWMEIPILARARGLMLEAIEYPLSISAIAAECGVSARELQYLFERHIGSSPKKYYLELRIQHAKHLLLYSPLSISDTGLASGFASPSAYFRAFQAHCQTSPRRYRQAFRSGGSHPSGRRMY
ncbi:MAG: helix-turn-helix domain-containing protein [Rhizobiaceae bacterium]|nr:helix-turn-helix domain-containing protein [Rhizobiaceae bacterium]